MEPITFNHVYYVESDSIPLNPIAIDPTIIKMTIAWDDTSKGKTIEFTEIKYDEENPPKKIEIIVGEKHLSLISLSLEIYNQFVRHRVAGEIEFNSDQAVQDYYQKTSFES